MEHPKYHEIVRPAREIVSHIGQWVLDKILPTEIFDDFVQGPQEPTYRQPPLPYDDQGNWHNPDGRYVGAPVPDIQGRDL